MTFDWSIAATTGVVLALGLTTIAVGRHLQRTGLAVLGAVMALIGVFALSAIVYFKNRGKQPSKPAAAAAPAPEAGGNTEIDILVREADQSLAHANAGATIANMPLIFVIGDRCTAKTSTVVNSGIEPELLAGQLYQDNTIVPTRVANLWFAHGTALAEAGGPILADPANWLRLVKRLQPGKLKSLKGGDQSPRAVLLCVSLESFAQQGGADAMAAAARYVQARLAEVAQTLGIRFPVYILFTKTDRVRFFTDFVGTFNNDEAAQVFGATVPILPAKQIGIYADDETRRLTAYYDNLFYSLCDKRTVFPPRENDIDKVCGAYEFPREMRKLRDLVVRFMVDVCRPSQLTTSPFLRGFYFSGVRPIVISDAAPIVAGNPQESDYQAVGSSSATGMFRVGKKAEMMAQQAVAQPTAAGRKVPQWMFLGNFFKDIILGDTVALAASGASVKVSALRRGLLIGASVASLALAGIFFWSYDGNHSLETQALNAADNTKADPLPAKDLPTLASLQQLEILRESLDTLNTYENDYTPLSLRWGLYHGTEMLPEVRRLYFERFRALLFGQTRDGLRKVMKSVKSPPSQNAEYKYPYDTLKGFLLTTNEHFKRASQDSSLGEFLGTLLLTRWSENRENDIGKDRMNLAKEQFEYYACTLSDGINPYSDNPEPETVKNTRIYLNGFKGPQRVYNALLNEARKKGKPITFNEWAEGSSAVLLSTYPVAIAYTTPGAKYMMDQIAKANFGGEKWVLGDFGSATDDKETMQKGITDLYSKDYIKQWRAVLTTSKVVPYANLEDAPKKLSIITDSTAPILALFSWTSQNTAVDVPGVKEAFQSVRDVEPPTEARYVHPVQAYNDSLQNLQSSIEEAIKAHDLDSLNAVKVAANAAHKETRKVASGLTPDPAGHLQNVVEELMTKPITEAERVSQPPNPVDKLNQSGAAFCSSFGPITKRFPFTRGSSDAERLRNSVTLKDLDDIFKPGSGKLWALNKDLSEFIDCASGDCKVVGKPPFKVNQEFLTFFSQAVKWSRAFYRADGTGPSLQYSLRPKKARDLDWPKTFKIEIDGDGWNADGDEQKSFTWPSGQKENFILTLLPGPPRPAESFPGAWAVFRFLAASREITGNEYQFLYHATLLQGSEAKPVYYYFTVETSAPVFNPYLTKCVATVGTKP